MLTSIIIPARNEEKNIITTIQKILKVFFEYKKNVEIVVIDDGSKDQTFKIVSDLSLKEPFLRIVQNKGVNGIGNAIRVGLDNFRGDCVIIAMADGSDDPNDMIKMIEKIEEGYDCCFGYRWGEKNLVSNYPFHKLLLNRIVNFGIKILFHLQYNDTTNAFKCYSKKTIQGITPIISHHFNVTVELPLKAIIRNYSYAVVPTRWYGRQFGTSSLKIKEMGSRYLFIVLYLWLEKTLSRGDYKKNE